MYTGYFSYLDANWMLLSILYSGYTWRVNLKKFNKLNLFVYSVHVFLFGYPTTDCVVKGGQMEHERFYRISALGCEAPASLDQAIVSLFLLSGPPLCDSQKMLFIELDLVWCSGYGLHKRMYGMCS